MTWYTIGLVALATVTIVGGLRVVLGGAAAMLVTALVGRLAPMPGS